jgi:hypothetical protein
MQALPQDGNLGLLFFLLFFSFAALGVEMFGRLGGWGRGREAAVSNRVAAILECGHADGFKDLYCKGPHSIKYRQI